ncbi:MAG: hypothetical protein K2Y23_13885 [Cyanobacteria bacterium]|nr:hypothetical protein [Cyanobacteriota bacterium]
MIFLVGLDQVLAAIAGVIANRVGWTPVGRACSMQLTEGFPGEIDRIIEGRVERVMTDNGRISGSTPIVVTLNAPWHSPARELEPISEILLAPRYAGHGAARLLFSGSFVNGYRVTASSAIDASSPGIVGIFILRLGSRATRATPSSAS